MTRPIHVWFEDGVEKGAQVRRLIFEGHEGAGNSRAETWWRIPGVTGLSVPPVLDSFVNGHVLWAARCGQDLLVHGPMSHGGLYNMGQLIEIRHVLSPDMYPRRISVIPDQVVAVSRPADDPGLAMAAFSGGLDSTFTAVRHARRLVGATAFRLAGLVMVHGFDTPIDRPDQFDEMRRRVEPLARWLELPLYTVATNAQLTGGRAWPQAAIPLTASALAQFSGRCAVGVVSAGAPHGIPRFGIAHGPALDALSSNDFFQVVTDGGGFGRADKIEALSRFPQAIATIKVCWEGPDPARNCGYCQKCVMTRLNFLAAGLPDPPCFETPLEVAHVARLDLRSLHDARDLFRLCWNELERRGRTGPAVDLLRRRLARVPPNDHIPAALRRVGRLIRRVVPVRARQVIRRRLPAWLRL